MKTRPKFEYTEGQYIHHGMEEKNKGKLEAFLQMEATAVSMMVTAYLEGDEVRSSVLRDVIKRIQGNATSVREEEEYLRRVGQRIAR